MSKFILRERFAYNFETALTNAGMQDAYGEEEKPKFWRGQVDDTEKDLFLLYSVSEPIDTENADNDLFRQQLFIDGQLFTRSGYGDSNFQELAEAIEEECKKANIFIKWTGEGRDNSVDTESPIYFVNFEAQQRLLNK